MISPAGVHEGGEADGLLEAEKKTQTDAVWPRSWEQLGNGAFPVFWQPMQRSQESLGSLAAVLAGENHKGPLVGKHWFSTIVLF